MEGGKLLIQCAMLLMSFLMVTQSWPVTNCAQQADCLRWRFGDNTCAGDLPEVCIYWEPFSDSSSCWKEVNDTIGHVCPLTGEASNATLEWGHGVENQICACSDGVQAEFAIQDGTPKTVPVDSTNAEANSYAIGDETLQCEGYSTYCESHGETRWIIPVS